MQEPYCCRYVLCLKPLLDGWLRQTRDRGRDGWVPNKPGNTLRHSERRGQISPSRSVGILPTMASQVAREADESAMPAAEEPDTGGVGWLRYSDRYGRRAVPLPRPPAHPKRETTERKLGENSLLGR